MLEFELGLGDGKLILYSAKVYIKWKFLFSILVLRDHPCAAIGGFFHLWAKSCKIVTLDIFPYMILLAIIHVNLIYIIKVCLGFYPSLFSPKPPILVSCLFMKKTKKNSVEKKNFHWSRILSIIELPMCYSGFDVSFVIILYLIETFPASWGFSFWSMKEFLRRLLWLNSTG